MVARHLSIEAHYTLMFGIGPLEFGIFFIIVLIAVGPDRLPTFMRTVGKGVKEIRRAATDFRDAVGFDEMMRDVEVRPELNAPAVVPVAAKLIDTVADTDHTDDNSQPLNDEDLGAQAPDSVRADSIPPPAPIEVFGEKMDVEEDVS